MNSVSSNFKKSYQIIYFIISTAGVSKDMFELLCRDGTKRPISDYVNCNWGSVPTHAVVTTSATLYEQRRKYQKFLEKIVQLYSHTDSLTLTSTTERNTWDFNRDENTYNRDQDRFNRFKRQSFNRDQYNQNRQNENRDEYETRYRQSNPFDRYKPDRNQDNFFSNTGTFDEAHKFDDNEQNDTLYEKFNIFESVPKYGIHHNLLFQVKTQTIDNIQRSLPFSI